MSSYHDDLREICLDEQDGAESFEDVDEHCVSLSVLSDIRSVAYK